MVCLKTYLKSHIDSKNLTLTTWGLSKAVHIVEGRKDPDALNAHTQDVCSPTDQTTSLKNDHSRFQFDSEDECQ